MKQGADVVVVGGGVIGCAIAYALRKRGVEVVVLDQGEIGAQASSAATGMLAPLKPFAKPGDPYTTLLLSSLALFPTLIAELEEASDICIEYEQTGTLRVIRPKQIPRLERWIATWREAGFQLELLRDEQVRQCQPGLAADISAVLSHPHESQVNAPQFVKAYSRAAQKAGAIFSPQEKVIAFDHDGPVISGVRTAQGKAIACKQVVLAPGAWAARCGELLGLHLPVRPLRAQSLRVRQPHIQLQHMLFGEGAYLAPKRDGTIIVGVARDEAGFDVQTTHDGLTWLHGVAKRLVPALDERPIEQAWAGLLPITPDARPILGAAPDWENATLACGYNGYGLLLAARTADLLVEYILTDQVPEAIHPFSLERFSHLAQKRTEHEQNNTAGR